MGPVAAAGIPAETEHKLEEAVKEFTRAIDLGNESPQVARALVGLLSRLERYEELDRLVQKLKERRQDVSELTLITALDDLRRNQTERGLARARQVLSESSGNPADLLLLGRLYLLAGKVDQADRPLKRALELAPGSPDAWLAYIQVLAQSNRKEQAVKLVDEAGRRLPAEVSPVIQAQGFEEIEIDLGRKVL